MSHSRSQRGEVFSIIGPNGAGKTTILNLISRLYDAEGRRAHGRSTARTSPASPPHDVARRGIARTFQNTELFEHETVLKNLLIGRHVHRRQPFSIRVAFSLHPW